MCIGNTTSPAANNTTNVSWGDAWERPEVIPGPQVMPKVQDMGKPRKDTLKTKPKAQSSKTSGGTY
jgi:hypothetical protein